VHIRAFPFTVVLVLSAIACLEVDAAFASLGEKRSRSDKDINAIRRRNIAGDKNLGNWYSVAQEKEIGKRYSAEIERSFKVLDDRPLTDYVTRIAENIAKNSDAQMPITVRLLDTEQEETFTLPGGYQYISRGLLLRLENEGELASLLARGIAHTALRSDTRLMTREEWAKIGAVPLIFVGQSVPPNDTSGVTIPLTMLSFRRQSELEADYFGVQYVYKAGYSAESLVHVIERIWPPNQMSAKAFSPLPPTPDRVKALRKEIADLLPKRDGEIGSTPEFEGFKERLRSWKPKPVSTPTVANPLPQ
jgi:predicted Zn-dependent protease